MPKTSSSVPQGDIFRSRHLAVIANTNIIKPVESILSPPKLKITNNPPLPKSYPMQPAILITAPIETPLIAPRFTPIVERRIAAPILPAPVEARLPLVAPRFTAPLVAPAPIAAPIIPRVAAPEYAPNHGYTYSYAIEDPLTGDSKAAHESRRGDVVVGSYSLNDSDGTRRIVDYTAGPTGFNAVVRKEPLFAKAVLPPAPVIKTVLPAPLPRLAQTNQ